MNVTINIYFVSSEEMLSISPLCAGASIDYDEDYEFYRLGMDFLGFEGIKSIVGRLSELGCELTGYDLWVEEAEIENPACVGAVMVADEFWGCENDPQDVVNGRVGPDVLLQVDRCSRVTVARVGTDYVLSKKLAGALRDVREDLQFGAVAFRASDETDFVRLLNDPEVSVLSEASVFVLPSDKEHHVHCSGMWFAEAGEFPLPIFRDTLKIEENGWLNVIVLDLTTMKVLRSSFKELVLEPVFSKEDEFVNELFRAVGLLKEEVERSGQGM